MTESDGHGVSRDTNMAAVDEHVAMRAIISRALSGGRLTQFIAHSSSASTAAAASAATNRRPSTVLVVCRCTRHESWRYMVASLSNSVLFSSCCTDRPPRRSLSLSLHSLVSRSTLIRAKNRSLEHRKITAHALRSLCTAGTCNVSCLSLSVKPSECSLPVYLTG